MDYIAFRYRRKFQTKYTIRLLQISLNKKIKYVKKNVHF